MNPELDYLTFPLSPYLLSGSFQKGAHHVINYTPVKLLNLSTPYVKCSFLEDETCFKLHY